MFSWKPLSLKSHQFSHKCIASPLFYLFRWYISPEFWPALCVTHHYVLPCACILRLCKWTIFFPPMSLSFDSLIHMPQRQNLEGRKIRAFLPLWEPFVTIASWMIQRENGYLHFQLCFFHLLAEWSLCSRRPLVKCSFISSFIN